MFEQHGCGGTFPDDEYGIEEVTPRQGTEAGGTTVVITGQQGDDHFPVVHEVRFDNITAPGFERLAPLKLRCRTPPHKPGTVHVRVHFKGGSHGKRNYFTYTKAPQPSVSYVRPNTGPEQGKIGLTVAGGGFQEGR